MTTVVAFGLAAEPHSWLPAAVDAFPPERVSEAAATIAGGSVSLLIVDHAAAPAAAEALLTRVRECLGDAMPPVICCLDPQTDSSIARRLVAQHEARRLVFHPLEKAELLEEVAKVLGAPLPEPSAVDAARRDASLRSLRHRSRENVLGRLRVLEDALAGESLDRPDEGLRRLAEREAREIAASSTALDRPDAAAIASDLLRLLRARAGSRPGGLTAARELLVRLRHALEQEPRPPSAPAEAAPRSRLLIVDSDGHFVDMLVAAARFAGYDPAGATTTEVAREEILLRRPEVVLLDVGSDAGDAAGQSLLRSLSVLNPPVPVVALTSSTILMDRVQAARMGASVVLQKSMSPERVLAEVSALLQRMQAARPRIMAIDRDPGVRHALQELLRPEGLDVVSTSDPLDFWSLLESTSPDLIVLDAELPTVSGVELCRVVRNDPRWSSMPVVFLTARTDAATVQRIFTDGADDFVAKPFIGPELVTRIRNRLERSQLLRSLSESDPLTGLSNRRRALELVERLLALARRHGQPLCIALLDLDDFKRINDQYGHATGDRVLRRLAELLQRKFRGEDVVGRWGGEEFLLGMYGMTAADGERRLDDVLANFRAQEVADNGQPAVTASFSAGVAEYPGDGGEFEMLYRAADAALYRAKDAGRSRVVRAVVRGSER